MNRIVNGQALLILCCGFYLIWWYRGFRPGMNVNRVGGINALLLLITAVLGIAGLICCLFSTVEKSFPEKVNPVYIAVGGIVLYILFLLVTRYLFNRVVTTELMLIIGWTALEMEMINRLNAGGFLTDSRFIFMCIVIATAFIISMVLYVAYYSMEEMKAFYAAMVPLITEAVTMGILIGLTT